jgi:hypothetical protein
VSDNRSSMTSPVPRTSGGDGDEVASIWYVARAGKTQREGPFSLTELKNQFASGNLAAKDLVWKQGFPAWIAVQDVPGLVDVRGDSPVSMQPAIQGRAAPPPAVGKVISALTHPMFFFIAGLVFAALAVMTLLGSLVGLLLWKRAWFDGAVSFLLLFILCEAASGILEALRSMRKPD